MPAGMYSLFFFLFKLTFSYFYSESQLTRINKHRYNISLHIYPLPAILAKSSIIDIWQGPEYISELTMLNLTDLIELNWTKVIGLYLIKFLWDPYWGLFFWYRCTSFISYRINFQVMIGGSCFDYYYYHDHYFFI